MALGIMTALLTAGGPGYSLLRGTTAQEPETH